MLNYLAHVIAVMLATCIAVDIATAAPVAVGSSALIGTLDYSDTFTISGARNNFSTFEDYPVLGDYNGSGSVNAADYPVWRDTLGSTTDLRADGNANGVIDANDFNVWAANFNSIHRAALRVENSYASPPLYWTESNAWSQPGVSNAFHDSTTVVKPTNPNPMADSGLLEGPAVVPFVNGSEQVVLPYASLRSHFILQFDAVLTADRMNVRFFNAGQNPSAVPFSTGLTMFIRPDSFPNPSLPKVGLYNGAEVNTGLTVGISDTTQWNNYAFDVNVPANTINFYVNQVSRGIIDLNTIGGGAFSTFLTGQNISLGADAAGEALLMDNFQIGAPASGSAGSVGGNPAVPEPPTLAILWAALVALLPRFLWSRYAFADPSS
jgi:hypothetical protein